MAGWAAPEGTSADPWHVATEPIGSIGGTERLSPDSQDGVAHPLIVVSSGHLEVYGVSRSKATLHGRHELHHQLLEFAIVHAFRFSAQDRPGAFVN